MNLSFAAADLMVRGGSLALLALWSWLLLRDHRTVLAGRLAVAMNASIACHVFATIPGPFGLDGPVDWVVELGSVSVPALFWLFARAWFDDEQQIGWLSWLGVPVSMMLVSVVILNFPERNALFLSAGALLRGAMFVFAIAGLWTAWKGRDGDLIEERRRLRTRLVGAVGVFVVLTNGVEVAVFNDFAPERWRSLLQVGVMLLTLAFCATMFGIRQPDLLGRALRAPARTLMQDDGDDPLAARLIAHMEMDKPHRDETLTIAGLAAQLGEQEYRLRRLINGHLGHRNFAAFLNGYRLAEVKAALADPAQRDVPILTMALDAGFGSLGPFNRAFREQEGMTPSAYRARAS
jgi:AraC-like DNA-binding protein